MRDEPEKWEPIFRGRLHTLLGCNGGPAEFDELRAEAEERLGTANAVTLLIECSREYARSYRRPIKESVAAWEALRERAEGSLEEDETTLMAIRSYYARCFRFRGAPGDLDRVVELRREELDRRAAVRPEDDNLVGIARADLAVALTDRGRYGAFDQNLRHNAPAADLQEARELIEYEIDRRSKVFTPANSFAQHSNGILAAVLVSLAERSAGPEREAYAGTSLAMTAELIKYYWEYDGIRSFGLLKSELFHAQALTLAGRLSDGAREARLALGIAQRSKRNIDPGWPLIVVARTHLPLDPQAALSAASKALAKRLKFFPAASYRVVEAERFIESAG